MDNQQRKILEFCIGKWTHLIGLEKQIPRWTLYRIAKKLCGKRWLLHRHKKGYRTTQRGLKLLMVNKGKLIEDNDFIRKKKQLITDIKDEFEWTALWGEALEEERDVLGNQLSKDVELVSKAQRKWHLKMVEPLIEERKEQIRSFNKRLRRCEKLSTGLQKILEKNILKV